MNNHLTPSESCSECGAKLDTVQGFGHCGVCLFQFGLDRDNDFSGLKSGDRISRYRLEKKIGEGGCGIVFEAEQEEPMRRKVALKFIKLGLDTDRHVARFEAERQVLASLEHPNIAKIFDAGTTETGMPYFVMELVRGKSITRHCDEHALSLEKRVELFILVCVAVQHAHQKGIIHRDLKPSNILVVEGEQGEKAVPRIIDFGLAKTIDPLSNEAGASNPFLGTLAYMSPEQAGGNPADLDIRSDIYSLGVLLYELLAGETPFNATKLRRLSAREFARLLSEEEPARPSHRLTQIPPAQLASVSAKRRCQPGALPGKLRDELDWVVMKCLEKDPARRYETIFDLVDDFRGIAANRMIKARPPMNSYRCQKFFRRNRQTLITASVLACTLIAGIAGGIWCYRVEMSARQVTASATQTAGEAEAHSKASDWAFSHEAKKNLENSRSRQ